MAMTDTNMTGAELISAERLRQMTIKELGGEGWTPEHDDQHKKGEMSDAATCYMFAVTACIYGLIPSITPPSIWPWEDQHWKPSEDPTKNLIKAGALIAAEIDRLIRLKQKDLS